MSEKYSESQINDFIFNWYSHLFSSDIDIKVIQISPLWKNINLQAIIQLNKVPYNQALQSGKVLIGFDTCKVNDMVDATIVTNSIILLKPIRTICDVHESNDSPLTSNFRLKDLSQISKLYGVTLLNRELTPMTN